MMGIVAWSILLPYLVGYVYTFRRIAGQIAWHVCMNPSYSWDRGRQFPSGEQWAGGIFASLFASLVWPISLPIAHGITANNSGHGFFYIPSERKQEIQARRIRELEKAAGIR